MNMLDKFLGKKDAKDDKPLERVVVDPARPRAKAAGSPPAGDPPRPALTVSEESLAAEERAREAMAAIRAPAAASQGPSLPAGAGVREQAAAYFAAGEHRRAIDLLVAHLNQTAGAAPRSIWFMLMDAYQALGQQAAFEKSASLFAGFFKTSPPSWTAGRPAPSTVGNLGRHVLVLDGAPARAQPGKLKDFVAAARQFGQARLDLSRTRLDEDHAQRADDMKTLLGLMRRLRRHGVPTLLMGENQLVEVLRAVIQKDLPLPQPELYWELLLEFLQWRGQEDAFEDLAIAFGEKFHRSAPGYEPTGVVAVAPGDQDGPDDAPGALDPPERLDEAAMAAWCDRVETLPEPPSIEHPLVLDFLFVREVAFSAAGLLASRLKRWGWAPGAVVVAQPSELVVALFDITGVSGQVHIQPRRR